MYCLNLLDTFGLTWKILRSCLVCALTSDPEQFSLWIPLGTSCHLRETHDWVRNSSSPSQDCYGLYISELEEEGPQPGMAFSYLVLGKSFCSLLALWAWYSFGFSVATLIGFVSQHYLVTCRSRKSHSLDVLGKVRDKDLNPFGLWKGIWITVPNFFCKYSDYWAMAEKVPPL